MKFRLTEEFDDDYYGVEFENCGELIDWLKKHRFLKIEEIDATTEDGYGYQLWWSSPRVNLSSYPIVQIDFNHKTVFHEEGPENPTAIGYKMFVNKTIRFLEEHLRSS